MKNNQKHPFRLGHCGQWMIGILATGGAAYLLLPDFRQQILTALPWLILLLCPFMHVFMHRGHGKHQDGDHDKS